MVDAAPTPTRWCCTPSSSTCCSASTFSVLVLAFGRSLYGALGGEGESLEAALLYSNVVFAGVGLVWLMNALGQRHPRHRQHARALAGDLYRGGRCWCRSRPLLIFGFGPIPALGIAGAGIAVILTTALTAAVLAWYIGSGRSLVRLRFARLRPALFSDILRVGAVGSISTLQTTLTVALTTALVGAAGGPDAIAGYGTGARLEYLLIPLVFGLGAPLVALVGTNIGAGEQARALRIALVGGALAFGITETIGLAAAIWPHAWLGLFGDDPRMLETGTAYLRSVGPAYGFFGLGLSLYFASQGAAPALLAAVRRAAAPAHRGRRRLGRLAPDRLARLAVCRSGGRARRLWPDARRGGRIRRLVPNGLAAQRPPIPHEDAHEE